MVRQSALIMSGCLLLARAVDGASDPRLSCEIVTSRGTLHRPGGPTSVRNLESMHLKVIIDSSGVALDPLRFGVEGGLGSNLTVKVSPISSGQKAPVEVNLREVGRSSQGARRELLLAFAIPIPASDRSEAINAYISKATASPAPEEEEIAAALSRKPEELRRAFDDIYLEHRVGDFEVGCNYETTRPGFWTGRVTAALTALTVVFEGKFFDQPAFR